MVISKTRLARAVLLAAPALIGTPAFAADPDQGGGCRTCFEERPSRGPE